ncbi:MAG: hypothetical protein II295_06340 [Akkermansia sp.]|nr:hypothetical protein [Akkermansia sp.]
MLSLRNIGIVLASVVLLSVIFIPDWFEDPVKLAIGEWKGEPNGIQGEVSEQQVYWQVGGRRGRFSYTWVQTEKEPYRVRFARGENVFEADVEFNGRNEAVLQPLVFEQLPELAQEFIRKKNKARNRPENELIFVFRRVKSE